MSLSGGLLKALVPLWGGEHNISDGSGLETNYNQWRTPKELLVGCVGVCAQPRAPCGINLRCFGATDFPLLAGICSVHVHPMEKCILPGRALAP